MVRFKRFSTIAIVSLLAALFAGAPARADVSVGDVITAKETDRVRGLISPGIEWMVREGMRITVGEYSPVALPQPYVDATKLYSRDVRISADGRNVENWVAGLPFPKLDPNDPAGRAQDHVQLRGALVGDRRPRPA